MLNVADLKILVTNVVNENRLKHCRLCLREIQENCWKFEDSVFSPDNLSFVTLGETIGSLIGQEICEVPGVDAVCPDCVDKIVECTRFIEKCRKSTDLLFKIFDNLNEALKIDIATTSKNHKLYVIVGEDESNVVLMGHEDEKKLRKRNTSQDLYVCDVCNVSCKTRSDLKVHNFSCHDTSLLSCEECDETFTDETEFERHSINGHNYKCSVCNKFQSSEEALKIHQDRAHTAYVCKECGKECRGLDKLQSHEERHDAKSRCPKCDKAYTTKSFYDKHVKLCLENKLDPHPYRAKIEKTYYCEKCGKGYSTPGGLRVHDRFVHGNAKPHTCKCCGKQFTAPSYLKIHMVKHTKERNFNCSTCFKNFVSKEALLYHTRRHTGEKPYSCKFCSERFVNASGRAEHIKYKHTVPKLTCEYCTRKFFTTSFMKQHLNRHHDPSSKLYIGRSMIPPNMPGEQNMRTKAENLDES